MLQNNFVHSQSRHNFRQFISTLNNYSYSTLPTPLNYTFTAETTIQLPIFLSFLAITLAINFCTFIGNGLVFFTIFLVRSFRQDPTNLLILNLAMADMLMAIFIEPITIYTEVCIIILYTIQYTGTRLHRRLKTNN